MDDAQYNRRNPYLFPINYDDLTKNFCYSEMAAFDEGRWWTTVTHMWLHGDLQHLQSNLTVLIPAGYAVTKQFGIIHCWGVFLGGGIFAALEGWGRDFQNKQRLATTFALPKELGAVSKWWDDGVRRFAPVLAKYTNVYFGCSAGVAALQGMTVMVWIEQLVHALVSPEQAGPPSAALAIVVIPNLVSIFTYYTTEFSKVSSGQRSGIDHAGHVAGFCFGIGCFGLSKVVSFLFKNDRKTKSRRR